MSWLSDLTDEQRKEMESIRANINHARKGSSATKYLRHDGNGVVEKRSHGIVSGRSMFPYKSTAMAVQPYEVPELQDRLRKEGVFVDFDSEGRPEITSSAQQRKLAKAMGMFSGRDGYGSVDELGNFQNTGRNRTAEMEQGREKVRKAINELESMPDNAPISAIDDVLDKYDICPTEENTG